MRPDPGGPRSIVEVAEHMLSIHDDLLDDDEDVSSPPTEEEALEVVRREYVSGTCAAFAIALHDATGWPIVAINGGLHVATRRPDGVLVDFVGACGFDEVCARYGMTSPPVSEWTREEAVDHVLMGEEEGDPWSDVSVARWVMKALERW
jgi:hypothetical protein